MGRRARGGLIQRRSYDTEGMLVKEHDTAQKSEMRGLSRSIALVGAKEGTLQKLHGKVGTANHRLTNATAARIAAERLCDVERAFYFAELLPGLLRDLEEVRRWPSPPVAATRRP